MLAACACACCSLATSLYADVYSTSHTPSPVRVEIRLSPIVTVLDQTSVCLSPRSPIGCRTSPSPCWVVPQSSSCWSSAQRSMQQRKHKGGRCWLPLRWRCGKRCSCRQQRQQQRHAWPSGGAVVTFRACRGARCMWAAGLTCRKSIVASHHRTDSA